MQDTRRTRDVVFLFRPNKAGRATHHTFAFGDRQRPLTDKLLHPFARWSQGIDWETPYVRSLTQALYPSVIVRCLMHAQMVARHAPQGFSLRCTSDPAVKDAIVVVHKGLVNKEPLLRKLRKDNNILLADLIDGALDRENAPFFDGVVCCARRGYAYYAAEPDMPPVFFVAHCADIRLPRNMALPESFAPCYFGAPQNFICYDDMALRPTAVFTDADNVANERWMQSLPLANFHYALRRNIDPPPSFKPFMKGIIAAHCGANMLVHADDGDAALYLGEDYPYLIHEPLSETVVSEYMRKAAEEFGGPEWRRGLERMRAVKEATGETTIAGEFWDMIRALA